MKTIRKLKSHNDLDGVAPGILAKLAFGEETEVMYCSTSGIDKAVERFLDKPENKDVYLYITDISVHDENALRLQERYKNHQGVCLIDHHVSAEALNQYEWATVQTAYLDGRKTCATSLFYEHLLKEGHLEETQALNEFVELVRSYDTWEWSETGNIKAKQLNDLLYIVGIPNFEESMIKRLKENTESFSFDSLEETILQMEEEKILRYIGQKERQMVETYVAPYYFGIVHGEQYHSELGNELGKRYPHLDAVAIVNVGSKKVSFRTVHDHVNVSAFAKNYGGGGHPKSSGASLTEELMQQFVVNVFALTPRKQDPEKNKYNTKGSLYGVVYENAEGNLFWIHEMQGKWQIRWNQKQEEQLFATYQEAENWLKRKASVWLSMDDVLIASYVKKYGVKEATLRSQFEKTMNTIFVKSH